MAIIRASWKAKLQFWPWPEALRERKEVVQKTRGGKKAPQQGVRLAQGTGEHSLIQQGQWEDKVLGTQKW